MDYLLKQWTAFKASEYDLGRLTHTPYGLQFQAAAKDVAHMLYRTIGVPPLHHWMWCETQESMACIHDKFWKWSRGRLFMYAPGFRVNASCNAASHLLTVTHKMMCWYVSILVFKIKKPISNFNTWKIILKFIKKMIQISLIFGAITFYHECCKSKRKKGEREWSGRQF